MPSSVLSATRKSSALIKAELTLKSSVSASSERRAARKSGVSSKLARCSAVDGASERLSRRSSWPVYLSVGGRPHLQ